MQFFAVMLTSAVLTVNSYSIDPNCNIPFAGGPYDMRTTIDWCFQDDMMDSIKDILTQANTGLRPSVIDKAKQFVSGNSIVSCAGSCGGCACFHWSNEPHIQIGDTAMRGFIESKRDFSTESEWCRRRIVCYQVYHELMHYVDVINGGDSLDHDAGGCDPEQMPYSEMDCAMDWFFTASMGGITCASTTANACLVSSCSPGCRPYGNTIFAKTHNLSFEISQNTLYEIVAFVALLLLSSMLCFFNCKRWREKRKEYLYSQIKRIASDEENI
jgi:hypothetical protein